VRRFLLQWVAAWLVLGTTAGVEICSAAPLISGFVDGFRNRFNWRVYAANAPDNPHATPGEFTYVYWQQAIGGEIPLYGISLVGDDANLLGDITSTGVVPFTGAEPDTIGTALWAWDDFILTQGQRTSSLYVTSPDAPGVVGAYLQNCNPIVCDIFPTSAIGPVTPPPPPGDLNLDGIVDPEDYDAWKATFGASDYGADANQNGIVDAPDYTIWRDHLDSSFVLTAATTIPEPATAILAATFIVLLRWPRRKLPAVSDLHELCAQSIWQCSRISAGVAT
jgi:hypothetical protein